MANKLSVYFLSKGLSSTSVYEVTMFVVFGVETRSRDTCVILTSYTRWQKFPIVLMLSDPAVQSFRWFPMFLFLSILSIFFRKSSRNFWQSSVKSNASAALSLYCRMCLFRFYRDTPWTYCTPEITNREYSPGGNPLLKRKFEN